jgi:hypothetical protein
MDSKQHQVCCSLQCRREHWEQEEAQGMAPDQPQEDLHQGDPLAMNWQMFGPNWGPQNFKRRAGCKISTWMNKRSSKRPSTATSTPNDQSFKNKDAHQDPTCRDSGCFSNPKINKLSLMRLFIQLTLFCSIVHAGNYHSNQLFTQDQQHLVVFKELGLMFNPSNLSDAWTENNTNLEESVTNYLNSEHQSNTWPLNETQTLFKNLPSVELLNLEATLFITDPIAKIIKDIHHQGNEMTNQLNRLKRTVTQGILGSLGGTFQPTNFHFPNLETSPKSNIGKLYQLFQLQPFPWIINDVPLIPQNQNEQILAIPINDQSEPIQFSMEQLHSCKQVISLLFCDLDNLTIQPTQESCLIALANKQYLGATHLCQFTISCPLKLLYQLQSDQYLLYLADH